MPGVPTTPTKSKIRSWPRQRNRTSIRRCRVRVYKKIVDLHDTKSQSLVWRGIAQDTLSNNGNKNQQLVQKAIQKMFKQWPTS